VAEVRKKAVNRECQPPAGRNEGRQEVEKRVYIETSGTIYVWLCSS